MVALVEEVKVLVIEAAFEVVEDLAVIALDLGTGGVMAIGVAVVASAAAALEEATETEASEAVSATEEMNTNKVVSGWVTLIFPSSFWLTHLSIYFFGLPEEVVAQESGITAVVVSMITSQMGMATLVLAALAGHRQEEDMEGIGATLNVKVLVGMTIVMPNVHDIK